MSGVFGFLLCDFCLLFLLLFVHFFSLFGLLCRRSGGVCLCWTSARTSAELIWGSKDKAKTNQNKDRQQVEHKDVATTTPSAKPRMGNSSSRRTPGIWRSFSLRCSLSLWCPSSPSRWLQSHDGLDVPDPRQSVSSLFLSSPTRLMLTLNNQSIKPSL